jgi:hypothetical protein
MGAVAFRIPETLRVRFREWVKSKPQESLYEVVSQKQSPDPLRFLQQVSTDLLISRQPRSGGTSEKITQFRIMLRRGHRMPPIEVAPDGNGHFIVLDGHHRLWAAQDEGVPRVPITIAGTPTTEALVTDYGIVLREYSSDQPRNDRGQWMSGGGTAGAKSQIYMRPVQPKESMPTLMRARIRQYWQNGDTP